MEISQPFESAPLLNASKDSMMIPNSPNTNLEHKRFRNLIYKRDTAATKVTHQLIIFANPRSGSQRAARFLTIANRDFYVRRKVQNQAGMCQLVSGHITNVLNDQHRIEVRLKIKQALLDSSIQVVFVMMGGDGGLTNTLVYLREEISFDNI
jgi:hypothetical protein